MKIFLHRRDISSMEHPSISRLLQWHTNHRSSRIILRDRISRTHRQIKPHTCGSNLWRYFSVCGNVWLPFFKSINDVFEFSNHYSSVTESCPTGNWGWIPLDTERDELNAHEYSICHAPEMAVPIEKWVHTAEPHVQVGNWMRFAFVNAEPPSVQSDALVRATRAYPVYAASDVVCTPASHGSAVWSAT